MQQIGAPLGWRAVNHPGDHSIQVIIHPGVDHSGSQPGARFKSELGLVDFGPSSITTGLDEVELGLEIPGNNTAIIPREYFLINAPERPRAVSDVPSARQPTIAR